MEVASALERLFVRAVSAPRLSRVTGRLADARLPGPLLRPLLRAYVRAYGVDMGEAREPLAAYPTFNAFFTRRLREGARPVEADPSVMVAPTDSLVTSLGRVPADGRIDQVKGMSYPLEALLASAEDAARFRHGVHATLYLSPRMYHRVHVPADGRVVAWRYVPGRLFPVNTMAVRHVEGLFTVNERVAVMLETGRFGPLALVMVGAANVGRMTLAFDGLVTNRGAAPSHVRPAVPVAVGKGDELGAFNLGSTVVLLAADGSLLPQVAAGAFVRMGEPLWRRPA